MTRTTRRYTYLLLLLQQLLLLLEVRRGGGGHPLLPGLRISTMPGQTRRPSVAETMPTRRQFCSMTPYRW